MQSAQYWIDKLGLIKHPEGGYYRETFRSQQQIIINDAAGSNSRSAGTAIYYLLRDADRSHFHKLQSDELWFHHTGSAICVYSIDKSGKLKKKLLGSDTDAGQSFQISIPSNTWFAAELLEQGTYSLVSCTVFPGFEFSDFQLAKRSSLIKLYPQHSDIICHFTNED